MSNDSRPLVAHVMYRFDTGGLENGIVNLINHMPADRYRHAVIALTEVTDFRHRIKRDDVEFISLYKVPGHGIWLFPRLFALFRRLLPAIVHSRNLAALEAQLPACAAGFPVRIHGEHVRDVGDLDGSNVTYPRVRRFYRPFVNYYLALSRDLRDYLTNEIKVPEDKVLQVYNGVDTDYFHPAGLDHAILGRQLPRHEHWIIGTIGRMQTLKDQPMLVRAFIRALEIDPSLSRRLRLVMISDGPLRAECKQLVEASRISHLAWLPGERNDVSEIMGGLDCFVLPSLAEGISNTILEAMAPGLPVIATDAGGNADLAKSRITGQIVPAGDPEALALQIVKFANAARRTKIMGRLCREGVEETIGMNAMVAACLGVYEQLLGRSGTAA